MAHINVGPTAQVYRFDFHGLQALGDVELELIVGGTAAYGKISGPMAGSVRKGNISTDTASFTVMLPPGDYSTWDSDYPLIVLCDSATGQARLYPGTQGVGGFVAGPVAP